MKLKYFLITALGLAQATLAQTPEVLKAKLEKKADAMKDRVTLWRRDFHENPELSNREFKTCEKIAAHLKMLGLEPKIVAKTGVVAVLQGGKPGPCIALRADIDGLPVKERGDLPFKSKATGEYNNQTVPVMHACGHDAHTAILMGVAEILTSVKSELKGSVKFIFQPAEEGSPIGEKGGAPLMIEEGALLAPNVEAIFGLHVISSVDVGKIAYRPGGAMASSDLLRIKIKGKQAHGANPWQGIDPVVTAAHVVTGLQTVVSRHTDLTKSAAVVTVGTFHGGVRSNIIPEEVEMSGTIRVLDEEVQDKVHENIKRAAVNIAESQGAIAEVIIDKTNPVTFNDPKLTDMMEESLMAAAGKDNVYVSAAWTGAEDFAWYQKKVPGLFFFLGGKPTGKPLDQVASHHTPDFYIDEAGFTLGMKAFCHLVVDYAERVKK